MKLDADEKNRLAKNINTLTNLKNYQFQTIVLSESVDEERVADIFVRINSKGVHLNSADFILTLMSVFWEQGRQDLESFSRAAKTPSSGTPSPFNYFIQPSPDQLLRASVGLAFRRGNLRYIYALLRGKNLETGEVSPEWREAQFKILHDAHDATLNLTNWHEFLKCLRQAGFRSRRMISSETAVMYVYVMWLIGRIDFNVEIKVLRNVIARWWFMAHTTSRYTNSPETQIESDLKKLKGIPKGDATMFCELLNHIITDTFTPDYWEIALPNRLDTTSNKSPSLSAYWAALNILEAEVLFSQQKVSEMLDPSITPIRNMERHHLFPRDHLEKLNITDNIQVNAISNMAFVDWNRNLEISNSGPSDYWPKLKEQLNPERLRRQMHWHALPLGWDQLAYDEFRDKRRKLISTVVKEAFEQLYESQSRDYVQMSVSEIISFGESQTLEFKERARWSYGTDLKDKSEQLIVKSLAGFTNCEGGTLLIGVSDSGEVLGIEQDYETFTKRKNRDGFQLFLTELIKNKLGANIATLCQISFHDIDGKDICRVDVVPSSKPIFTSMQKGQRPTDFWVRMGNRTEQLFGESVIEYTTNHWG